MCEVSAHVFGCVHVLSVEGVCMCGVCVCVVRVYAADVITYLQALIPQDLCITFTHTLGQTIS